MSIPFQKLWHGFDCCIIPGCLLSFKEYIKIMDFHFKLLKRSGNFDDSGPICDDTSGEDCSSSSSRIFADDDEEFKRKLREIENPNTIGMQRKALDGRNKMHIPKIVKSDIRRQYGVMFANVYNSLDCEMMKSFTSLYFNSSRFVYSQRDQHITQGTKYKQFHINSLETFHISTLCDSRDICFAF